MLLEALPQISLIIITGQEKKSKGFLKKRKLFLRAAHGKMKSDRKEKIRDKMNET